METFDNIHLDFSKQPGRCRFADSGLGWKPSGGGGGETYTIEKSNMVQGFWNKSARGYEVKIYTKDGGIVQFDGFQLEDLDRLKKVFQQWFGISLEVKEHSIRGWNWGKAEFGKAELSFNVQSRSAFEIPYSEIVNTNLAGKNEVVVEFSLPGDGDETGTNGHLGGARARGKKSGGARDQLTEMRFYIPGTTTAKGRKQENGESGSESESGDEAEEQNAATNFYETLVEKAEIGEVAGDTYATFLEVLHLTPRGRFDIDMCEKSFRMRGKTYDYRIPYEQAKKFMLLPKPDDQHMLLAIGLEPPLRQGQTRYPFVVMQFKKDEEVTLDLNMANELYEEKYKGKLQNHYEDPYHSVVSKVFEGLSGRRVHQPSPDFQSHHQQKGVKCSIKANEGHLYCMEKSFMFIPKPATYIPFENIVKITMSRVGGARAERRTFDISIMLKAAAGELMFSNINREEQQPLEDFFRLKKIKIKNEMEDESGALLAAALKDDDLASSEEEVVQANRGSADEDDESVDEDFRSDSDSDVAEEFDSQHDSSGSDSDAEMADAGGADSDAAAVPERPKKKVKTSK